MARHDGIGPYSAENLYCTMQGVDIINVAQKAKVVGGKRGAATAMATRSSPVPGKASTMKAIPT
jgi:hypothetical protein